MSDKLTDNEIKKALEHCASGKMCFNCPFKHITSWRDECAKFFLALINRQDEEINRLQAENDNLKNDELPKCKDALRRANEIGMELQAENERLNEEAKTIRAYIHDNGLEWDLLSYLKELVGEQPTPNNVKCIDCEYLEFKMPYGICGKGYMGIVHPDDSCGKGKLEETAGGDNA